MAEVDTRMLRMLVAVADEGVMARAAERLHVSQPALSRQLAQVERTTGLTLFERHPKGMRPTPAGRIVIERARMIVRGLDDFAETVGRVRRELSGTLRVGYIAQTLNERTRAVIHDFEQRYVGVDVERRQYDMRDMTAGLHRGETDVALLRQPLAAPDLVHEPIFVEPRVAVLYAAHPAARGTSTTLAALFDTPWVVNATTDPAFRDFQLATGYRAGRPPMVGPTVNTIDEYLDAVVSERAIGLGPASAARYYPRPGVVFVPVRDAEPSICSLSWRRDSELTTAAAAFIELVRNRLPQMTGVAGR